MLAFILSSPAPRYCIWILTCALAATGLHAQTVENKTADDKTADQSGWIISIGGMATYGPQYIGAKKLGPNGSPSFNFRRADEKEEFSSPDDSLDYTLYGTDQFRLGVVGNIRPGRSTQNDPRLAGLSNYPWTLEAGIFVELWPVPDRFRTRIEIRRGLWADDGLTMDLSADAINKFGAFTLSGGPRLSLADAAIMNQEFGVTVPEAIQNKHVWPFHASGGIRSIGLAMALNYDWSKTWQTTFYQRFDRLVGDAAASSITRELGSKNQFTAGLGLTYSFHIDGF